MKRMIIADSGEYRMLTPEEYFRREEEWVSEQLGLANPKPSGALGMWAWHIRMKRNFARNVGQERPVKETTPYQPSQAKPSSFSEFWRTTAEQYRQGK